MQILPEWAKWEMGREWGEGKMVVSVFKDKELSGTWELAPENHKPSPGRWGKPEMWALDSSTQESVSVWIYMYVCVQRCVCIPLEPEPSEANCVCALLTLTKVYLRGHFIPCDTVILLSSSWHLCPCAVPFMKIVLTEYHVGIIENQQCAISNIRL